MTTKAIELYELGISYYLDDEKWRKLPNYKRWDTTYDYFIKAKEEGFIETDEIPTWGLNYSTYLREYKEKKYISISFLISQCEWLQSIAKRP